MLARVFARATCLSVCLSVRPSVRLSHAGIVYWIGLSMVLRLRQHNIRVGYTADGFYRSDDPTNSVKALKEGG